jgi:hypothetical protein
MIKCEQKKMKMVEGKSILCWEEVLASNLPSGVQPDIRCIYCHGEVRVHRKYVEHGPKDHVEHLLRQDSETCRGGHYFKGDHQISSLAVK